MRPTLLLPFLLLLFTTTLLAQPQFTAADLKPNSETDLESKFMVYEIERFTPDDAEDVVFLRNGYAKSEIGNAKVWERKMATNRATEINLIYTKYPRNKELWRTNYRGLMMNRLKALFAIDSSLNSADIEWNIILQTACTTEPEAMAMLHGIEIVFEPIPTETAEPIVLDTAVVDTAKAPTPAEDELPRKVAVESRKLERFMKRIHDSGDSTVEKVLDRHPEWNDMLVVMDWSGSMHEFSTKVIRWHFKNYRESGITNVAIFCDGDRDHKKGKIGDSGGVYYAPSSDPKAVIKLMRANMSGFYNKDIQENNIEGLVKATKYFGKPSQLVMIADNRSCMKDYCLCDLVDVPVRIVLCGTEGGINPQYVNLAYRTGGSIHTMESDIQGFDGYKVRSSVLNIDGWSFIYNSKTDRFEELGLEPGQRLGYQDCDRFYKVSGRCKKVVASRSK